MSALDMRDAETEGHSERVVHFALRLARELEAVGIPALDTQALHELALGALLHDIGKMSIPDVILRKPGALTEEEWTVMRRHPQMGVDQLERFPHIAPALPVVRSHHER